MNKKKSQAADAFEQEKQVGQAAQKKKPSVAPERSEQPEQFEERQDQDTTPLQEGLEGLDFPSRSSLENQLTAMEMRVEEYEDRFLRMQAELKNVRRRAEHDIANAHKFGLERLLQDLIPVLDGMVLGLESPRSQDTHAKAMRTAMEMTLDMLQKTLIKFGVELIDPKVGDPFDPTQHQAMSMLSDPGAESNSIHEVVQKGYQLNGRVLRAAMVVVVS